MEKHGIIPMLVDWTKGEPLIGEVLSDGFGRDSIPFYAVVPPDGPAITPPPSPLTPGNLVKALELGVK